jgi:hypothetical protein
MIVFALGVAWFCLFGNSSANDGSDRSCVGRNGNGSVEFGSSVDGEGVLAVKEPAGVSCL